MSVTIHTHTHARTRTRQTAHLKKASTQSSARAGRAGVGGGVGDAAGARGGGGGDGNLASGASYQVDSLASSATQFVSGARRHKPPCLLPLVALAYTIAY